LIGCWSTTGLAEAIGASVCGVDTAFTSVTTDSRKSCVDSLFVALKGINFDAHKFVGQACAQGAVAALTDHPVESAVDRITQVVVENTTTGLGQMGALNRNRFSGKVVAVTGSAGKTTVKELVAAIFVQRGPVCKTQGNLNNHIGVPLSLLTLEQDHQGAVFELGASGLHEIAYTVGLVRPDVAVINNAQTAHMEGFGSLENIMIAKGEIVRDMPGHGVAVLNADDKYFSQWRVMANAKRTLSFGLSESADVTARDMRLHPMSSEFTLVCQGENIRINLPLPGEHNICNALAASAAALAAEVSVEQIRAGLENVPATPGRLVSKSGLQGCTVLDDTYNASPAAMKEALRVLASHSGRKIAVLGHMAELGELAAGSHAEAGSWARQLGIDELWVTGAWAKNYQQGFGKQTYVFDSKNQLTVELAACLQAGDMVLVKGSRSAGMEEVVSALCPAREKQ
jgi:UDP-N-acetylmuramoyl-tripeptide--D-alanyl-D-alanine ligase